jgi:uncharacterized membrane protein
VDAAFWQFVRRILTFAVVWGFILHAVNAWFLKPAFGDYFNWYIWLVQFPVTFFAGMVAADVIGAQLKERIRNENSW